MLTTCFHDLIQKRVSEDQAFRDALLREGIECLLAGEVETGKTVLRDYINAKIDKNPSEAEAPHLGN